MALRAATGKTYLTRDHVPLRWQPSPSGAAMMSRVTLPLATVLVLGIAHRAANARRGGAGAVEHAGSRLAALRTAEQRLERLGCRAVPSDGRAAPAVGGDEVEIGRNHQRRLTLHGEFVGTIAVELKAAAAAAAGAPRPAPRAMTGEFVLFITWLSAASAVRCSWRRRPRRHPCRA